VIEGIAQISLPELRSLRQAIAQQRLRFPLTPTDLQAAGFGARAPFLCAALADLDATAAARTLDLLIADREHRSHPELDLVWTGPEPTHATSRDTAIVVRQLFEAAERSVLVGGYSFDHGTAILAPLHAAMKERSVHARLFMDIPGHAAPGQDPAAYATEQIDRFLHRNWTFGPPLPEIYYDPRSAEPQSRASLHAKCVVVDHRHTFVTSANFTARGHDRNIEVGVLIEDARFAERLAAHWNGLVGAGLVRRYEG